MRAYLDPDSEKALRVHFGLAGAKGLGASDGGGGRCDLLAGYNKTGLNSQKKVLGYTAPSKLI